jgi:hypothetical protein
MENLASACIAYAATAKAPTLSIAKHAAVFAILICAAIGWFWLFNKGLEFALPRLARLYNSAYDRYMHWRYPEPSDEDERAADLDWLEFERERIEMAERDSKSVGYY